MSIGQLIYLTAHIEETRQLQHQEWVAEQQAITEMHIELNIDEARMIHIDWDAIANPNITGPTADEFDDIIAQFASL